MVAKHLTTNKHTIETEILFYITVGECTLCNLYSTNFRNKVYFEQLHFFDFFTQVKFDILVVGTMV